MDRATLVHKLNMIGSGWRTSSNEDAEIFRSWLKELTGLTPPEGIDGPAADRNNMAAYMLNALNHSAIGIQFQEPSESFSIDEDVAIPVILRLLSLPKVRKDIYFNTEGTENIRSVLSTLVNGSWVSIGEFREAMHELSAFEEMSERQRKIRDLRMELARLEAEND